MTSLVIPVSRWPNWLGASLLALSAIGVMAAARAADQTGRSGDPAVADTTAENDTSLQEIIVTAQKRSQRLLDVPDSISVLSAEAILDRTVTQLSDLSTSVPNVYFRNSSTFPSITIRGISSESGLDAGIPPATGVYVDEVYQGRDAAQNFPVDGIERIEVLRGPQGTLYGKNTIGGALNITTQRPTSEFRASGDLLTGNLGLNQESLTVSGPLIADKVLAIATVFQRHRDGYIHNTFTDSDLNGDSEFGGRTRILINASDNLPIELAADYLHQKSSDAELTTAFEFDPTTLPAPLNTLQVPDFRKRQIAVDGPYYSNRTVYGVSGRFDYDFQSVKLTSISAYRHYDSAHAEDFDGTPVNLIDESTRENSDSFSQEARLTSTTSGPLKWIVGAYYYYEHVVAPQTATLGKLFPVFLSNGLSGPLTADESSQQLGSITENSIAGFASVTYDLTNQLTLSPGLRYTNENKTLHYSQTPPPGSFSEMFFFPTIMPLQERLTEGAPTGDISLSYKFTDYQVGYVKYSRGYKAGGFQSDFLSAYIPGVSSLAFHPEYLDNYEAGFKGAWLNNRMSLDASIFYNKYTNKQEVVDDPAGTSLVTNAARATTYGAEFELNGRPLPGLELSGTLGLLHTRYDSFVSFLGDLTGNQLTGATPLQGSVAAQYKRPIAVSFSGMARLEAVHSSSVYWDNVNSPELRQRPWTELTARIGIETDKWGLYLWGKNLTDTFVLSRGTIILNGIQPVVERAVNLPRTFGAEMRVKY